MCSQSLFKANSRTAIISIISSYHINISFNQKNKSWQVAGSCPLKKSSAQEDWREVAKSQQYSLPSAFLNLFALIWSLRHTQDLCTNIPNAEREEYLQSQHWHCSVSAWQICGKFGPPKPDFSDSAGLWQKSSLFVHSSRKGQGVVHPQAIYTSSA